MSAAHHLADLAADLTSRNASGERTLKVWGHRRGLSLPEVRRLVAQLVAQGLLVEGEGAGGPVWRPVERTGRDLPPLEIETGEPSPTPPPVSVERAAEAPSFEIEKEEVPVAGVEEAPAFAEEKAPAEPETPSVADAVEEPILVAGAVEPCRGCEQAQQALLKHERAVYDLRLRFLSALDGSAQETWEQVLDRVRRERSRNYEPHRQLATRTAERDEALRERDELLRRLETPPAEPHPPAPSPRSLFAGLAPEARRNVADVLQELVNHLRQEPTPSGKIGRGPDNLSSNARAVLAILPRGGEPSITRKEIKARSGLSNTNSVSTALRTLERLTLATSPSWGFWRAV